MSFAWPIELLFSFIAVGFSQRNKEYKGFGFSQTIAIAKPYID
jgi:hypothetical protein